ncbi:MAG TPA: hypothetical protein VK008_07510 [Sphingobacteriaceae bacterium]|nr:hypothetical protein [Sphingobacteriaceae bacterium]
MSRRRSVVEVPLAKGDYLDHAIKNFDPLLLVFYTDEVDYGPFLRAVSKVLEERDDEISLVRADIKDLEPLFAELRATKGYHAYDFDRLPALGLFRSGQLITTFNPILPVSRKVMEKEIEQQFRRFVEVFVDYDPEKLTFNHR